MTRHRTLRTDTHAAVGIGTMIVFIATVLVAAIAAGVLIDMSGKLQSRSQTTGQEATSQVSSNLAVASVIGNRTGTSGNLEVIDLYVQLAAGAEDVDLSETRVQYQNSTTLDTYQHEDAALTALQALRFNVTEERDADDSFTAANPTMNSGDLVRIRIPLYLNSAEAPPRDNLMIVLLPEVGSSVTAEFRTPNSFGSDSVVPLF